MDDGPLLELKGVSKSFGSHQVLKAISLNVAAGEFLTFLGPSGCGKTTLLRMIGGLERPDSGSIFLSGRDVTDVPPYKRNVHTVFQHYSLFPHLSVFENVAFSLRLKKLGDAAVEDSVREALALVKLSGFEKRPIHQLSGGQQQRIALARSLVGRPSLLLLDEPLGALDFKLRLQMQMELKGIQKQTGIAFIYVTHDQEEALTLSDRIAVFNAGEIVQLGTPEHVYERPVSSFVADFIGAANIFEGALRLDKAGVPQLVLDEQIEIAVPPPDRLALDAGEKCPVAIRPARLEVLFSHPRNPVPGLAHFRAYVKEVAYLGATTQLLCAPSPGSQKTISVVIDNIVASELARSTALNRKIWLRMKTRDILILNGRMAQQAAQPSSEPVAVTPDLPFIPPVEADGAYPAVPADPVSSACPT